MFHIYVILIQKLISLFYYLFRGNTFGLRVTNFGTQIGYEHFAATWAVFEISVFDVSLLCNAPFFDSDLRGFRYKL